MRNIIHQSMALLCETILQAGLQNISCRNSVDLLHTFRRSIVLQFKLQYAQVFFKSLSTKPQNQI